MKLLPSHPLHRRLLILNLAFLALVSFALWRTVGTERARFVQVPAPAGDGVVSASSTPIRLIIPTIEVDAHVDPVGKTRAGNMDVPKNFEDVGWYRLGVAPGEKGNAVLAGHLDNGKGREAVFYDLGELSIDDLVYVENEEGVLLAFKVTGMSLYDYDNAPLELIFGKTDKVMLNLITCDGIWMPEEKLYDKRLVVFTELVGEVDGVPG